MSSTGVKSTSFQVWASTFLVGLGSEIYAVTGKHLTAGAVGFAAQAVAGIVKTWHDHGIRTAAIAAGRDLEQVVISDISKTA